MFLKNEEDKLVPVNNTLRLKSLGNFTQNGRTHELGQYFIDTKGQLYSRNLDTWEVNHRQNKDLLICSNGSTNNSGEIINSLRSAVGTKVTIMRSNISWYKLNTPEIELEVENTTPRHLKVLKYKVGA